MAQVAIPINNHQHHHHHHHYQPTNQTHFTTPNTDSAISSPSEARLPPLATTGVSVTVNANSNPASSTSTTTNTPFSATPISPVPYLLSNPSNQMLNPHQQSLPLQLPPLNMPATSLYQLQLQQLQQEQLQQQQVQQQQQQQQQQQPNLNNYPFIQTRSTSELSMYSNILNSHSSQSSQNSLPSLNLVLNRIQSSSSMMLPSISSYSNTTSDLKANLNTNLNTNSNTLLSSSPSSINSNNSLTINNIDNSIPNRKYKCLKCNKGFTTSGHLARHNRIHTGVKNHVCPFEGCQSRFSRQDNCMQHYKTHLKAKKSRKKSPKVPGRD